MDNLPKVVLAIESSRASGRDLLRGIAEYARHHGPWAFHWEPGGFENVSGRLRSLDADGIILRDVEGVEEVLRYGVPAIVVGHSKREVAGISNVLTHSRMIASLAAEHLIDCGFVTFAFVGYEGIPWSDERRAGFVESVERAGYSTQVYSRSAAKSTDAAHLAAWLEKLPLPIGLMACNDDRAQNVVEACKLVGLRVPDEVGIIGADNDELVCELADPPLTSVAINFERAGLESARLLHQLMNRRGKKLRTSNVIVEPTHVVPRQSTDILFIDDMPVSRAVRYIRQNGCRQIGVSDVVQAAGLSRRVLEKRFRSVVGRSVLSEIRRVRVGQISRMLIETNQSVSEIAAATGFSGVEHFARYFRQGQDMTPLAYRKAYGRK